ncbi:MAG: thymidine phosphorylase [Opitutaceae bacterium]|nr:thymidine phosphorylase [Opitutaceae bacterium]
MNIVDVIRKKRDGGVLNREEIEFWIRGTVSGAIPDYQVSALLMALFLRGMNDEEAAVLTDVMAHSGSMFTPDDLGGYTVDKHSTGGVGDKTTLVLIPLLAAAGLKVGKLSGRALGHTGGTIDKLESIPGFRTDLSLEAYRAQVARIGCALIGQTKDLAPSDKKLYALRDVTATVECIPLICGSILSKKLAEGIDALVLDVKFGRGAFMKTLAEARQLAEALVAVGRAGGKNVRALLTAMDQPLGRAVGNALEVAESIACLRGAGPADLMEVTYALGAHMLILGGVAQDEGEARAKLEGVVRDGSALAKLREIVEAQGGDVRAIDDPARLPQAKFKVPLPAPRAGVICDVDAMGVALAALCLGAGRAQADDRIDPAVGVDALVKVGERVAAGAPLCVIHASDEKALAEARQMLAAAIVVGDTAPKAQPLIAEVL